MNARLLHIFRNTPLGRETAFQSVYFCKQVGATPTIYVPKHKRFLMYFENDVIQIDLDDSYLTDPGTAVSHAAEVFSEGGGQPEFLAPKDFTASELPDIPAEFDFMCCPRSISDLSTKIGLGHIGPRVRRIVNSARFPVLIASPVYKPWKSISVFFGGSDNSIKAMKLGINISKQSGMPLYVYSQKEKGYEKALDRAMADPMLKMSVDDTVKKWSVFEQGLFEENLYTVPHDALVVLGAYGHGLIKQLIFGSKMEKIQSVINNNLLIVGPHCVVGF